MDSTEHDIMEDQILQAHLYWNYGKNRTFQLNDMGEETNSRTRKSFSLTSFINTQLWKLVALRIQKLLFEMLFLQRIFSYCQSKHAIFIISEKSFLYQYFYMNLYYNLKFLKFLQDDFSIQPSCFFILV